jgi:hypothetical protein
MDIDYLLRSFELPSDQPHWEAALLAQISDPAPVSAGLQEQASFTPLQPALTAVALPFTRPATA